MCRCIPLKGIHTHVYIENTHWNTHPIVWSFGDVQDVQRMTVGGLPDLEQRPVVDHLLDGCVCLVAVASDCLAYLIGRPRCLVLEYVGDVVDLALCLGL